MKLRTLFPIPKFLSAEPIGIDISDGSVKFVQFKDTSTGPRLGIFGEKELPADTIISGVVNNIDALVSALSEIKKETGAQVASVSLPEEQAYLISLRLPFVPVASLREEIELHIEDHVPLSVSDVEFGYDILRYPESDKDSYDLSCAVMPKKIIEGYTSPFDRADLGISLLEIETHAVARAIIPHSMSGAVMIVDIGKKRTGIGIVSEHVLSFSSTIPVGGDQITVAISKGLDISFEEADLLKLSKGISREKGDINLLSAMAPPLAALKDEVTKNLVFWSTHKNEFGVDRKPIERIYIVGGSSNLRGIDAYLSIGMGVPVSYGNPWINIASFDDYIPPMEEASSLRFTTAIGLVLGSLNYD